MMLLSLFVPETLNLNLTKSSIVMESHLLIVIFLFILSEKKLKILDFISDPKSDLLIF